MLLYDNTRNSFRAGALDCADYRCRENGLPKRTGWAWCVTGRNTGLDRSHYYRCDCAYTGCSTAGGFEAWFCLPFLSRACTPWRDSMSTLPTGFACAATVDRLSHGGWRRLFDSHPSPPYLPHLHVLRSRMRRSSRMPASEVCNLREAAYDSQTVRAHSTT